MFKQKRKSFALKTKNWKEEWRQVVFSDEKLFQTYSNGRVLVKRVRGESENPKYINFAIQQEKISLNLWCCVSYGRKPIIYLAGPNFDSAAYIRILSDVINNKLPGFSNAFVLQQDNASLHVSDLAKKYFSDEVLTVLTWPPCSPDMNIVEQIWSILQKKLDRKLVKTRVRNNDHLLEIIKDLANEITVEQVNKLYDSMPNRIKSLIKNSGGFTSY